METMFYCYNCQTMQHSKIIKKMQTLNIKGRDITLEVQVRVCDICGEEIFDEELDTKTLNEFYNEYRKKEKLLLPEEIKNIRKKYNLSQTSFAKLLGFGEKTIARYENGSIQDACHDNLIRLMDSYEAFALLWKTRKNCLSIKEQARVDCLLRNYNKTKTCSMLSPYNSTPVYSLKHSNMYLISKGGVPDAS